LSESAKGTELKSLFILPKQSKTQKIKGKAEQVKSKVQEEVGKAKKKICTKSEQAING